MTPQETTSERELLNEISDILSEIEGLVKYLRHGGPDAMDLQGLSDGLSEACDLATAAGGLLVKLQAATRAPVAGAEPAAFIQKDALKELLKHKTATATVASGLLKTPFGDVVALHAAPQAAMPSQEEWQPIETAPKDGTDVLITSAGFGMLVRIGFWDEAREGVWSIWPGRERMQPTHWQPLPAPPLSRVSEQEGAIPRPDGCAGSNAPENGSAL